MPGTRRLGRPPVPTLSAIEVEGPQQMLLLIGHGEPRGALSANQKSQGLFRRRSILSTTARRASIGCLGCRAGCGARACVRYRLLPMSPGRTPRMNGGERVRPSA